MGFTRSAYKKLAGRSMTAVIIRNLYNDWKNRHLFRSGDINTSVESTSRMSPDELVDYINRVFNSYLNYTGLKPKELRDKKVLEVGPGESFGVALRFLAAGVGQMVCLDKYYCKRDPEKEQKIYLKLREQLPVESLPLFDTVIQSVNGLIRLKPDKFRYICGNGIEKAVDFNEPHVFDLIVSTAVLQEIYPIEEAFSNMDRLLAPGGMLAHKVDLRDYRMFTQYGMHGLTFLTVPEFLYRLMSENSRKVNRRRIDYYRNQMEQLGYDYKIFITHVLGKEGGIWPYKEKLDPSMDYSGDTINLIDQIRPKLSKSFKDLPDEDLMVMGIFLVAKKPA